MTGNWGIPFPKPGISWYCKFRYDIIWNSSHLFLKSSKIYELKTPSGQNLLRPSNWGWKGKEGRSFNLAEELFVWASADLIGAAENKTKSRCWWRWKPVPKLRSFMTKGTFRLELAFWLPCYRTGRQHLPSCSNDLLSWKKKRSDKNDDEVIFLTSCSTVFFWRNMLGSSPFFKVTPYLHF